MGLPFANIIDGIKADLAPHAANIRDQCDMFSHRVIARLDVLIANTADSEYIEYRRVTNLALTADAAPVHLIHALPGEDWELELVTVLSACSITITESERFRYAKQFDTADCQPGIGLIIRENSDIQIASSGNATPVKISVQFKRKRDPNTRAARTTGQLEPADLHMTRRGLTDPGVHANAEKMGMEPHWRDNVSQQETSSNVQVTTPRTDEHTFGGA